MNEFKFDELGPVFSAIKCYLKDKDYENMVFKELVRFSEEGPKVGRLLVMNQLYNYSTTRFRTFCADCLGFDYWDDRSMDDALLIGNSIDAIDSAMCSYKRGIVDIHSRVIIYLVDNNKETVSELFKNKGAAGVMLFAFALAEEFFNRKSNQSNPYIQWVAYLNNWIEGKANQVGFGK
jgi:hypothetical protein